MHKNLQRIVFFLLVGVAVAVLAGGFVPPSVHADGIASNDTAYTQMNVYEEVLRKIQNFYVTVPNLSDVTDGSLHGMLESLDADSSYLTPAQFTAYKARLAESGNAAANQGAGMTVSKRYGYATVVSVVPGGPADKAGIQSGDVIEAINKVSTHAMSLAMIRMSMEGKAGTAVALDMIVPNQEKPVIKQVVCGPVAMPAMVTARYAGNSILYLKPLVLTRDRVTEMISALKQMKKSGDHKVLLDLRDVSTGDELQGVRLANAFLAKGTIGSLSGQTYTAVTYTSDPSKFVTAAPLVVLVNRGTAGAAEMVAAAVLELKRGDVLGDKTFGSGGVQKTFDLPDGSALLLTIAKYNGPDGKPIEDTGVRPSIPVSLSIDQFLAQEYGPTATPAHPMVDDQLNKALDVLKAKQS